MARSGKTSRRNRRLQYESYYRLLGAVWILLMYCTLKLVRPNIYFSHHTTGSVSCPNSPIIMSNVTIMGRSYLKSNVRVTSGLMMRRTTPVFVPGHHQMRIQPSIRDVRYNKTGKGIDHIDEILYTQKIINPHPYRYIINPIDFCKGERLLFIVYVHSAPDYVQRRNFIRRTWGDNKLHNGVFKVLFVLGKSYRNIQQALQAEADDYGDILQEDFLDSYHNLTIKGIAALKWIDRYCNEAKFVLKSDDDTFVNTFNYIAYINRVTRYFDQYQTNTIFCAVWHRMTVLRRGKWKVNYEDYSGKSYPSYCSGCAFTMTMDVARAIHKVSYHVAPFWVDDVYVSGLLPQRIGNVTHKSLGYTYQMNSTALTETFTGPQWWRFVFSSDNRDLGKMEAVWRRILQLRKILSK